MSAWPIEQAWEHPHPRLWEYHARIGAGAPSTDDELIELAREGRKDGNAALVCDVTTLRAMRHLARTELVPATDLARTASRMARTESLRASECFAGLVLARARRLGGEPHRATQILRTLERYAPTPFLDWLHWELVLSGPCEEPRTLHASRLHHVLQLASHAPATFEAALLALRSALPPDVALTHDLAVVAVAHGLAWNHTECPSEVLAWQGGQGRTLPWGLAGLSTASQPVFVTVAPGLAGTRMLATALPLLEHFARLPETPGNQARSDALLATLALAGPHGDTDERVFEAVYGFPFVRGTHQGVFDVLVHRARARVEPHARIQRTTKGYVLVPSQPLLIPDPRSGPRDDDRVLRLAATRGVLTAREASVTLGVSLRKAQQVLDSLASSGACVQIKAGRHFEYRVEDTTFQEPTDVGPGA